MTTDKCQKKPKCVCISILVSFPDVGKPSCVGIMKLAQARARGSHGRNGRSAQINSSAFWPLPSVTARQCVCLSDSLQTCACHRLRQWGEICASGRGLSWQQRPIRKQISGVIMTIKTAEKLVCGRFHIYSEHHFVDTKPGSRQL